MDPIHPIAPGPPAIQRASSVPVERLERVSRERDRPSSDAQQRRKREARTRGASREDDEDDGRAHIDVCA